VEFDMTVAASRAEKIDPINERYFKAVERADNATDGLFYLTAALSLSLLFVDKASSPRVFDIAQIAFVVLVFLLFAIGAASRLYWAANALDARRKDLLSNAYGVPLTHEQTAGYYNNDETDPIRRLGVATMENTFFTRAIASEMARRERWRSSIYLVAFLVAAMCRQWDLALAGTAAQVVFGEQIISRWVRLEWLRSRSARAFDGLYALFQSPPVKLKLHAKVLEWVGYYEASKDGAGITLSEKIFNKMNPSLTVEWERLKSLLRL
jgi:hypothetical protein